MKIIIVQIVAGTLFYLAFGWILFDLFLGSYTDRNTTHIEGFKRSPGEMYFSFLVISCFAYACLITFILYFTKTTSVKKGFLISCIVGILIAIMTDSYWYATSNFYNNIYVMLLDIIAAGVSVGSLGAIITIISNRFTSHYFNKHS